MCAQQANRARPPPFSLSFPCQTDNAWTRNPSQAHQTIIQMTPTGRARTAFRLDIPFVLRARPHTQRTSPALSLPTLPRLRPRTIPPGTDSSRPFSPQSVSSFRPPSIHRSFRSSTYYLYSPNQQTTPQSSAPPPPRSFAAAPSSKSPLKPPTDRTQLTVSVR